MTECTMTFYTITVKNPEDNNRLYGLMEFTVLQDGTTKLKYTNDKNQYLKFADKMWAERIMYFLNIDGVIYTRQGDNSNEKE